MKNRWFSLLLTVVLLAACGKVSKIDGYGHAELFSLQKNERGEVVLAEILSGGEIWRYRFCPREEGCAVLGDREFRVAVPLRRTAVCTTTVLALIEAVGAEEAVVGVDGDYTTIKSFRERISRKEIPLLAEGMKLDREKLTALKPEAVFFSPAGGDWEEAEKIRLCQPGIRTGRDRGQRGAARQKGQHYRGRDAHQQAGAFDGGGLNGRMKKE